MKHFDINVHDWDEDGVWEAHVYALQPVGDGTYFTNSAETLAIVRLTAEEAADLDHPYDEWWGTDDGLPAVLEHALEVTLDELRSAA